MLKKILFGCVLGLSVSVANLGVALPVIDGKRDAKATLQQAQSYVSQVKQQIINKEEEKSETAEHGNADCGASPKNTKENNALKTEAFKYLYDKVLDSGFEDAADEIIKPEESYAENRTKVKETFFAQPNEDSGLTELGEKVNSYTKAAGINMSEKGLSTSEIIKVRELREEYASQVAAKNLKISLELREKVLEDMKSAQSVETSGCNQLHGLMLENRNLVALIKETSSDIMVQILTLESMGAKMLLKEDAGLISVPEKPSKDKK